MKKLLFSLLVVLFAATSHAQGYFNFDNTVGGTPEPVTRQSDNAPLSGDYTASLFWAVGNVSNPASLSLFALADTLFIPGQGGVTGTDGTGLFSLGPVNMGVAIGTTITVQVRAWQNTAGSYAAAAASGGTFLYGFSNLVPLILQDSGSAPDMVTLQPFKVSVPEPSTILMGGLGATALLMFRRRGARAVPCPQR